MSASENKTASSACALHDTGRCHAVDTIAVANHEAGHCVASYAAWSQRSVESVTIIPAEDYLGLVRHVDRDKDWRAALGDGRWVDAMAAESETVMFLAGHAAEARFLKSIEAVLYEFRRTVDSFGAQGASSDTWDDEAKPIHHVYAYWDRTWDLLRQSEVWLAVARVAGALLCRNELSGREIEAIVIEAGVEPDPERVPLFAPRDEDEEGEAFSWDRW
jgi:hypothetical protein